MRVTHRGHHGRDLLGLPVKGRRSTRRVFPRLGNTPAVPVSDIQGQTILKMLQRNWPSTKAI
jgi:hypothetical protein